MKLYRILTSLILLHQAHSNGKHKLKQDQSRPALDPVLSILQRKFSLRGDNTNSLRRSVSPEELGPPLSQTPEKPEPPQAPAPEEPVPPLAPAPEEPEPPLPPEPKEPKPPLPPEPEEPEPPLAPEPEEPEPPLAPEPEEPEPPLTPTPEEPGPPLTPTPEELEAPQYTNSEELEPPVDLMPEEFQPPQNQKPKEPEEIGPPPKPKDHDPLILTDYIKKNRLKEAKNDARVVSEALPPGIESYAGYFRVDPKHDSYLWFWYFPIPEKAVDTNPWILWLQGGPGVSSLNGLFYEIGPFGINEKHSLQELRYSWGSKHSLLFIDSPVGTGYSFTRNGTEGLVNNQTVPVPALILGIRDTPATHFPYHTKCDEIGEHLYNALQQFLTIFSELRPAPLTIVGESYAGKHVPSLGVQILRKRGEDKQINLHGFAIGNGWIDPMMVLYWHSFLRELGILDINYIDDVKKMAEDIMRSVYTGKMMAAYQGYITLVSFIFEHSALENATVAYNFLRDDYSQIDYTDFVQTKEIRRALHVGNVEFSDFVPVYDKLRKDFMSSSKKWLEELLEHFPILFYNGHLDVMIPYSASRNVYENFKFSGIAKYKKPDRYPWRHCGRLAGYYKQGGKLTEVMVRNAGHVVPRDQPAAALGLISAFVRGDSLKDTCAYADVNE